MAWAKYISQDAVKSFISDRYGLTVVETTLLEGYEDYNLKVRAYRAEDMNENITGGTERIYVLKITHPSTGERTVDLQNQLLLHLSKHGFETCYPLISSSGLYTEQITSPIDPNKCFRTRLLHYVNGYTFEECGRPLHLLRAVGEFVGKICNVLKDFSFDNYKPTTSLFELSKTPELDVHIQRHYIGDTKELALQVVQEYKNKILPVLHRLQHGFIHCDISGRNIILKRLEDGKVPNDFVISGVIDLGDACKSFYLYEIATVMADMMSNRFRDTNPLFVGGKLLAGFKQYFTLTDIELSLLKLCICIRLLQTHVLIEDLIKKQENKINQEYLEKCRINVLELCSVLWSTSDDAFNDFVIKGKEPPSEFPQA